ncbi:MAG TPA: MauE/DoxX family redox-associated membrane protein [Kineosporiaceae bacterium]
MPWSDAPAALDLGGRLVVTGAFGWAGLAKLADLASLRATLYLSRLTRPWVPQLSAGLPALELFLALALLGSRAGWFAAAASAALLVAFIAYLSLDSSTAQGCACFGARTSTSRRAGIVRDLLLLAALAPALARGPSAPRPGVPPAAEPWALAAAALLVAAVVRSGLGRSGRPARRSRRRSGRRRAGVAAVAEPVATRPAVPFDVVALDGTRLRLTELAARTGGVVLVFAEPGCVLCEELLPALAPRGDVVVLAAALDPAEVDRWAGGHGLLPSRVAADVDGALADSYGVPANPAACRVDGTGLLVDATGVPVARLSVGAEAITALLPLP